MVNFIILVEGPVLAAYQIIPLLTLGATVLPGGHSKHCGYRAVLVIHIVEGVFCAAIQATESCKWPESIINYYLVTFQGWVISPGL